AQGSCKPCPDGYTTEGTGAISSSQCNIRASNNDNNKVLCSKGSYLDTTTNSCLLCPEGTYQPNDNSTVSSCTECSKGSFADTIGQASCKPCTELKMFNAYCESCPTYGSVCLLYLCNAGYYQKMADRGCYDSCPKGTFSPGGHVFSCTQCSKGTYQDKEAQGSCKPCPDGYTTEGTGAQSENECNILTPKSSQGCALGQYLDSESSTCKSCSKGYYQDQANQTDCKKCPEGTTTMSEGSTRSSQCVSACNPTQFNPQNGECTLCNSEGNGCETFTCNQGYTQNGILCVTTCNKGYFSNINSCSRCPENTYQPDDNSGAMSCMSCGENVATCNTETGVVITCEEGYEKNSKGECVKPTCSTYDGEITSTAVINSIDGVPKQCSQVYGEFCSLCNCSGCTFCMQGYALNSEGKCIATRCTPGNFFNEVTSTCEICPIGHSCTGEGNEQPRICPVGTIAATQGTAECTPCPKGTYSSQEGSQSCQSCGEGTYSDKTGQSSCLTCSSGSHTTGQDATGVGATGCSKCNPGYYSSEGSVECEPCEAGSYSSDGKSCIECLAGTYSDGDANSICKPCPIGQYSSQNGATSCEVCPIGKTTSKTESTSEDACILVCDFHDFEIENGTCTSCNDLGNACGSFTCNTGFKQSENNCVCDSSLIKIENGTCEACEDKNECIKITCNEGFTLSQNSCVSMLNECPSGVELISSSFENCESSIACLKNKETKYYCEECKDGYALNLSHTACEKVNVVCAPGNYYDSKKKECEVCPAGTYSDGTSGCKNCSRGTFSLEGASQCSSCDSDKCAKGTGLSSCQSCGEGVEVCDPQWGTIEVCKEGYALSDGACVKLTSLPSCPINQTIYNSCPKGCKSCSVCKDGYYCSGGCGKGYTEKDGVCINNETGCRDGYIKTVMNTCYACPAGTFQDGRECKPCGKGFYSSEGSFACRLCRKGYHLVKGEYGFNIGCELCDIGTFALEDGLDKCKSCNDMTLLNGTCLECSITGNVCSKSKCNEGFEPQNLNNSCIKTCDKNVKTYMLYSKDRPNECSNFEQCKMDGGLNYYYCTSCQSGYSLNTTTGICERINTNCKAGQFQNIYNECETCPENLYQDEENQFECKPCLANMIPNDTRTACVPDHAFPCMSNVDEKGVCCDNYETIVSNEGDMPTKKCIGPICHPNYKWNKALSFCEQESTCPEGSMQQGCCCVPIDDRDGV
ncbi:MAG: hypothetical protein MJ247_07235, partial [Alphaproteobacteria bacterium]|nr:hypothetical protein [Alphaproteobacteria bacterium]